MTMPLFRTTLLKYSHFYVCLKKLLRHTSDMP